MPRPDLVSVFERKSRSLPHEKRSETEPVMPVIIALDGEGYTLKSGKHRYTYIAACSKDELISDLYNPRGIRTRALLDWLLTLPGAPAKLVGFSLGYDRTKWLEDLPPHVLYSLYHPDERVGAYGPRAVRCSGYSLNLVSTKFTVARLVKSKKKAGEGKYQRGMHRTEDSRTVWDVWRFYQSSFVRALRAWKVGSEQEVARIEAMKAKRGSFKTISVREREYCQSECKLLARLVEELLLAHEEEGLRLTRLYGPGTTASLVLDKCGVKQLPAGKDDTRWAQCAYFGGRFEASHVGPVRGPLYAYDIASAYPYALALLPCLHPEHGRWVRRRVTPSVLQEDVACVRYRIHSHRNAPLAWAPLPHRLSDGNIVFPSVSAGGWAWSVEIRPAMKLHPGIEPIEAWVWERKCDCPPPFRKEVVRLFIRRLEIGKTTRGMVVKLALNSMYGKSAQRVGSGQFRCMVRAGLVTARTRGMLTEAVLQAKDPWNILELATDSVMSREPLDLPAPISLGTEEAAKRAKKVVLGAWEEKEWDGGVFLLRPGLRFPVGRQARDLGSVAARGLGTKTLHENRRKVMRSWAREKMAPVFVQQPTMFHGAMSSVRKVLGDLTPWGEREFTYVRDDCYGKWQDPEPRRLSFAPGPKRKAILPAEGDAYRLSLWELPETEDACSCPYSKLELDDEESILRGEQPDGGDFTDYV